MWTGLSLFLFTAEMNTPQQNKEQLEELFKDFIKEVRFLTHHFTRDDQKATLRRFSFSYAFERQLETNRPLFCFYMSYSAGTLEYRTRTADQFELFFNYCHALHDLAYSMGN